MKLFLLVLCATLATTTLARPSSINEVAGSSATAVAQSSAHAQIGTASMGVTAGAQSSAQDGSIAGYQQPIYTQGQTIYGQIVAANAATFAQNQAFQQAVQQNIIENANQINIAHQNAIANAQAVASANAVASSNTAASEGIVSRFSETAAEPGSVGYTITSISNSPGTGVVTQTQTFSSGSGAAITDELASKFSQGNSQLITSSDGHTVTYVTSNLPINSAPVVIPHEGAHIMTQERFSTSNDKMAINPIDIRFSPETGSSSSSSSQSSSITQTNDHKPAFSSSSVSSSVTSVNGQTHGSVSSYNNNNGDVHTQNVVIAPTNV